MGKSIRNLLIGYTLVAGTIGFIITFMADGITAFAADKNLSYANVIGMENYLSMSDTVRGQIEDNIKNLPNSLLDLHKRYDATITFVDGAIPKACLNYSTPYYGEFKNEIVGVTYLEGEFENDIYVRTDDKAVYVLHGEYWRTISHELGHFAKHVTYDMWTQDMKEILASEYLVAKERYDQCYSEEETFAYEYSLYCESDSLVSDSMCNLFRKVEEMVKIQDIAMGAEDIPDPVRTDNVVERIEYNPINM